jgi:hypothetical protein
VLQGVSNQPEPDEPPPLAVPPHLLTWWFAVMSVGGIVVGVFGDQFQVGKSVLGHPLVIFFAVVAGSLLTLAFIYQKPLQKLISPASLVIGCLIGLACYFLGGWFGASLAAIP